MKICFAVWRIKGIAGTICPIWNCKSNIYINVNFKGIPSRLVECVYYLQINYPQTAHVNLCSCGGHGNLQYRNG